MRFTIAAQNGVEYGVFEGANELEAWRNMAVSSGYSVELDGDDNIIWPDDGDETYRLLGGPWCWVIRQAPMTDEEHRAAGVAHLDGLLAAIGLGPFSV